METKYCASCDTVKPLSEFRSDKSRKDGLYVSCKECQTSRNKERQRQYQARKRQRSKPASEKRNLHEQGLKRCRSCNEIKQLEEFHKTSNNRKKPDCKECANARWNAQKAGHVDQIVHELFGGWECQVCGYDRCRRSFDFHHRGTEAKDFNIASRYTPSYDVLKQEISKCVLLCANCHREVHGGFITLGN